MDIKTEFNLGQEVFAVRKVNGKALQTKCDVCDGTGFVMIKDYKYHCPKCGGDGLLFDKYSQYAYMVTNKSKIGKIMVDMDTKEFIEAYTLESTGVSSDAIWYSEELFATLDEAVAYCNEMNKKEGIDLDNVVEIEE